jgi:pantothenate kinase-related protein Tda10
MHKTIWSSEQLEGFHLAAESLKLFRRAELEDSENSAPLIRKLYVDPLPEEHIFKTVIKPSTTFIIGRKGTGKSTIFQRVQNELRGRDNTASAYVDIKTVYESSGIDAAMTCPPFLVQS